MQHTCCLGFRYLHISYEVLEAILRGLTKSYAENAALNYVIGSQDVISATNLQMVDGFLNILRYYYRLMGNLEQSPESAVRVNAYQWDSPH